MIERKIRLGEIITMIVVSFAVVGGWFALQNQVEANTKTIRQNINLIRELQEDVITVRDWQIRREAYEEGLTAGQTQKPGG